MGIGVTFFLILNIVACNHASAMMNFTDYGEKTKSPESLSGFKKLGVLIKGVRIPKPKNIKSPKDYGLIHETHRIVANDEVELEAWYVPSAATKGTILLFHGYASSKSQLLPEARIFHEMGYSVFLVDFRGSGGSNRNSTSFGYHEADDVAASLRYVREIISPDQPTILFGRSMGAAAILRSVAVNNIQPDKIILESVFNNLLTTTKNRFRSMGIPSFPSAYLLVFWGGIQSGFSGFRHNPAEYAEKVICPTLMLHGTEDPRAKITEAKSVYLQLAGDKTFIPFENIGHEPLQAKAPRKWNTEVQKFASNILTTDGLR